ncbi:MotE family protein [Mesobacillus subterraneus]|uniref:Magnesium transporter MgtE intracellular domain-containing protein n=1 Tax=Mesobacillus subterraneus TaxID=285983 RepID=A0A427TUZ0_9BACI|nr:MotE family protein [Mesobacillus subterraneus]RSD28022.1 hypothetical protein EJA10_06040 [Mesobacillus subterraneus]
MGQNLEEKESKQASRFQWFLGVVVIPVLFAVVMALIVLSFAGINIFESAKSIGAKMPFLSSIVKEENKPSIVEIENEVISLKAEIKDREAKMDQLQSKIESKDTQLKRMELEKAQLQAQIEELTAIQEENKRAFREIVKTYETMSAKSAAPIITKMETAEAIKILTNIKPETLAAIMEKMPAEEAAKYTELLTNESSSN